MAIVGCLLALAGIAGYFMPTPTEATPSRLLMENPGGRVVFTHKDHSTFGGRYGDNACADCHHELKVAAATPTDGEQPSVLNCTACHGTADDPDFIASHQDYYAENGGDKACAGCHHETFSGFSEKWNHKEHWEYAAEDCSTCHHTDGTTVSGRKMTNIRPQRCANCHTPRPNSMTPTVRKDAGHQSCATCHEDWFSKGVEGCRTCHSAKQEYTSCATCHNPIPGGMDAFHNSCMGCHDKAGKGPGKKAPCAQCHAPS